MTTLQAAEPVAVAIDGRTVQVPPGTLVVEAARQAGVHIPVFCYHPRLKPAGVCRMCLVKVEGQPKLVTACTTPVAPGMAVQTRDPLVQQAQRSVLEFLLLNHPLDCPVCDKGGECDLQDLTLRYGPGVSRLVDGKVRRPKAVQLGRFIVLDRERCILCRRCVRFDDEVAQEGQLVIEERAIASEVTTARGQPYDHLFTGNTIELCPVGALTSALYRFRARPWDLSSVASRCSLCSVHCPVRMDFRLGQLVRVVSPGAEGLLPFGAPGLMEAYHTPAEDVPGARAMGWLCDRGRFNYRYVHSPERLSLPLRGRGACKEAVGWEPALEEVVRAIVAAVREDGPGSVAVVGGGRLMAEEAFLLRELADRIGTPHRDHRVGGQAVASLATPGGASGRRSDLGEAQTLVVVGAAPLELAPVLDLEVRAARARGARVLSVGLRRPAYRGVEHHPAWGAGVADALRAVAPALLDGEGRVVMVWDAEGAWDGRAAAVGEALLELAERLEAAGRPVSILVPGAQPQSRAAEAAGLLPGPHGFNTLQILRAAADGRLRVLYLVGANLLATFPDAGLVERALERTPFVVVQDLFLTATARRADLVLPVLPAAMRGGTLVDLDGAVSRVDAAMPPDGPAQSDLAILARLLDGIGRALDGREGAARLPAAPDGLGRLEEVRERWPALANAVGGTPFPALGPRQARMAWAAGVGAAGVRDGSATAGEVAPARVRGAPAAGIRVARVERAFDGGGTSAFDPWLKPYRVGPCVLLNPEDAEAFGLKAGEPVEVRTAYGCLVAPAAIDASLLPGWAGVAGASEPACATRLVAWDDPYPAAEIRLAAVREVDR